MEDIALQDLNLLLPLTAGKTKATHILKGFNGCFTWMSSNPEVVQVEAIFQEENKIEKNPFFQKNSNSEGCSTEALISVSQNGLEKRSGSFIIAEDMISGRKVRCEVHVDKIHRIEIETTTRQLYHDDIEMLEVQAFDKIGNLFSTLEGIQFQWSIISANPNTANPPLQLVTFAETNIEVSSTLIKMEKQGKESHSVLIKGIESGKANVYTRLVEFGYESVEQDSVLMSVLEPLELHPLQPVYIAPRTFLQYELRTFKSEYSRTISMPNNQYIWTTSNSNVASVDSRGLVQALELGSTDVIVQYHDMQENNAQGFITVVWPSHITLKIKPLADEGKDTLGATSTNWFLVHGQCYSLIVEVYDNFSHRILTSPDMQFQVEIPQDSFNVMDHSRNHAQHSIVARKEGLTQISARLQTLVDSATRNIVQLPTPLVVRQEVVISPPVRIIPEHVRLPFDQKARHSYPLLATGGSKEYNWYSADNMIATVTSRGTVSSGQQGVTQVMAADSRNPSNRGLCAVSVLPVASVEIVPLQREVKVGESLLLGIAFYDEHGQRFDNCTALSFVWSIRDRSVFSSATTDFDVDQIPAEKKHLIEKSCTFRTIKAMAPGFSSISASFGSLRTEMTFFAYEDLTVSPNRALVTIGSSYLFQVSEGPNPWYFEPGVYQTDVVADRSSAVKVTPISLQGGRTNYRITCLDLGEQTLTFSSGNRPTSSNPFPSSSVARVTFSCFHPSSIFVRPVVSLVDFVPPSTQCAESYFWPTNEDYSSWPSSYSVIDTEPVQLESIILDHTGRKFNNISSLQFAWKSSNNIIGNVESSTSAKTNVNVNKKGSTSITSQIVGFQSRIISAAGIRSPPKITNIDSLQRHVEILAESDVSLSPSNQLLLLDSSSKAFVDIHGGSSITGISSNDTSILSLRNNPSQNNRIDIQGKQTGSIRLRVTDKCLQKSKPAFAFVSIATIDRIDIQVESAIAVNEEIQAEISVFDTFGRSFDAQFSLMKLDIQQDNSLVHIEPSIENPKLFTIRGVQPGTATILVRSSSTDVVSLPKQIYVYHSFSIDPERLVLLPGGSYQTEAQGGPPIGTIISFSSDHSSIASVSPSGKVTANKKGSTTIRAVSDGIDPETGKSIRYGEASMKILVKDLDGIQIAHASNTIIVGTEMNVFVVGVDGESPFSYGSNLQFLWKSSNGDVLEVSPRYAESGSSLEEEHMFSVGLLALSSGTARISVQTELPSSGLLSKSTILDTSALITVIDKLEILSPTELLLTPKTSYQIKTNLDHQGTMMYSLLQYNCNSRYQACKVSPNGVIEAVSSGDCFIHVQEIQSAQFKVIQVEVKPLDMVQIHPIGSETSSVFLTLPLHQETEFQLRYLDDVARPFDKVFNEEEFLVVTDSPETIGIRVLGGKEKILVQGLRPGSAIVKVEKTQFQDFIEIRVGNTLVPSAPHVHVGAKVHFQLQFAKDFELTNGVWRSSDMSVATVDSSGYAKAIAPGRAIISFGNELQETSSSITVSTIDQIESIHPNPQGFFTNYQKTKPYKIPLHFFAEGDQFNATTAFVDNQMLVQCKMEPREWATTKVIVQDNEIYCLVSMVPMKDIPLDNIVIPELLTLTIRVSDTSKTYSYDSNHVYPFYPELVTPGNVKKQLVLYKNNPFTQVHVKHGLSKVEIIPSSERISIHRLSSMLDSTLFEIHAVDVKESHSDSIAISSSSTGQSIQMEVLYSNVNQPNQWNSDTSNQRNTKPNPPTESYSIVEKSPQKSSAAQFIFISLITIVSLLLGYFFCKPQTPPMIKSPAAPKTPQRYMYSPVTPATGSRTPVF